MVCLSLGQAFAAQRFSLCMSILNSFRNSLFLADFTLCYWIYSAVGLIHATTVHYIPIDMKAKTKGKN